MTAPTEPDLKMRGFRAVALMREAVGASEMPATRHCIPEGCHLHTRRHENLKFHEPHLPLTSNAAGILTDYLIGIN
jgi:hypothetical protein